MDMEMEMEMGMELDVARDLVMDALRIVLPPTHLLEPEHSTLEDIGLSSPAVRRHFRGVLAERIREAGYEIDPAYIPHDATDTPMIIASVLPGRSTKRNPH